MADVEIDREFSHLWTKKYYVLVKSNGYDGYSIHDEETGMSTIIELDDIVPYILDKMVKNGCKIYESINELPKPTLRNRWDSMEEWISFCGIAKEFNPDNKEASEVSRYVGSNATREEIIKLIKLHFPRHR